jgi:hypothetical protein
VVGWFAAGIPYHSFAHKLFRHDDDFDDPHAALKGVGLFLAGNEDGGELLHSGFWMYLFHLIIIQSHHYHHHHHESLYKSERTSWLQSSK